MDGVEGYVRVGVPCTDGDIDGMSDAGCDGLIDGRCDFQYVWAICLYSSIIPPRNPKNYFVLSGHGVGLNEKEGL